MKVSYDEDLANHIGPESCVYFRKEMGEALTGESVGWVLSRERAITFGADVVGTYGRQHGAGRYRKSSFG